MKAPVYAAIDIGSNTTHVVVAHCTAHDLDILKDEVTMVRLGESVDESGEISPELQEKALQVLQHYKELAEQEQAEQILAVATEAIRKARNGEEFLKQIQEKTGLQVQILSGEAEAVLTFYGATYEMANEPGAPKEVAVTDVGQPVRFRQAQGEIERANPLAGEHEEPLLEADLVVVEVLDAGAATADTAAASS